MRKYRRLLSILFLSLLLAGLIVAPTLAQDETPPGSVEEPAPPVEQPAPEQVAAPPAYPTPGESTVVYNLYATDGFVTMADGTVQYIYGFVGGRQGIPLTYLDAAGLPVTIPTGAPDPTGGAIQPAELPLAGKAQFPAPIIYAAVGDVVEIRLKNLGVTQRSAPNDPHTIHLHGLDVPAANDGVPETSVAAVPAGAPNVGAGNVVVYMFTPTQPGTYMYHCHQEASIHVQMGMYGALVVYNQGEAGATTGPGTGGGNLWGHAYTKDVVLLLSEFDPLQHKAEQKGGSFNPVNFKPTYWFINGLSFPNTIHAGLGFNWTNWIAAHPGYDPFIVGSVGGGVGDPALADKVLLRVVNMGFQVQPMHMHGFHAYVIGSDQRPWAWTNDPTTGAPLLGKNTLTIGSGETYEWLIDFSEQTLSASYPAYTQTRYSGAGAPAYNTATTLPAIPDPFAPGFAYVGGPVVGPDGTQGGGLPSELPVVAGQFFPFHNHDDYKATNNGVYPGGMFTMILTMP
jgi:FtsP/CotA-like multicopper oxidase with cupredoxin domain